MPLSSIRPDSAAAFETSQTPPALRVAQAIALCNSLLKEMSFRIEGEVANFTVNRGLYVFFDLKDEQEEARLKCFMMANQLSVPLEDGMRVVVQARPGIHQKSGQFSLTVSRVEPKGEGSVKRAFELLRLKLQQEGLFSKERKRQIARYVQTVGIISSADAAGYGDFCKIALARLPGISFVMANVAVQGKEAEGEICAAFDYLNGRYDLDAIVLIRGGGSMEDLHAFNSELVARAIVRSKAPVVVGIGHERDITIACYCADLRAATPSNAAQLLLPTADEVRERVLYLTTDGRRRVEKSIQVTNERLASRGERMHQQLVHWVQQHRTNVEGMIRTITAISPEQTLKRGYSLSWGPDGKLLTSVGAVASGNRITTQLADGRLTSTVD